MVHWPTITKSIITVNSFWQIPCFVNARHFSAVRKDGGRLCSYWATCAGGGGHMGHGNPTDPMGSEFGCSTGFFLGQTFRMAWGFGDHITCLKPCLSVSVEDLPNLMWKMRTLTKPGPSPVKKSWISRRTVDFPPCKKTWFSASNGIFQKGFDLALGMTWWNMFVGNSSCYQNLQCGPAPSIAKLVRL